MAELTKVTVRLTDRSFIQRLGTNVQTVDLAVAERLVSQGKAVFLEGQQFMGGLDRMIHRAPVTKSADQPSTWEDSIFPQNILAAAG